MKIRTLVLTVALLTFILGIGGQATAAVPPSWLQMTMPSVTFNTVTKKLAVEDTGINAPLAANTLSNGNLTAGVGTFDTLQPYTVLNGTVFSRRLGWNDPAATSLIQYDINSVYGFQTDGFTPRGYVWIQSLSQSPGLNTYLAVGQNGVNADGSLTVDAMNPTGPIYSGIFGTAGSSTKWKWDTQMDHNAYAVPFSFLTKPNQIFSAYYKLFVGDAAGNELLTDLNGVAIASASTTTVWTWQGPPFVFTSQPGVTVSTLVESDVFTYAGASSPISVTGGEYAISLDGINWGGWTSLPGTIANTNRVKVRQTSSATAGTPTTATLAIPTATGSGIFSVTTAGTNPADTVPNAFAFTSLTIAPASTVTESSVVTVSGINTPSPISVSIGGQYAISTDGGLSWGDWTNIAGSVADTNRVKVRLTSSTTPGASVSTTLTIGGVSAAFSVTTGSPVTPSASFSSVTNAPANTSVSGMPFYATSNPIAASVDSTISIAGGITPQYSVSTDGGYNWSAWSATVPATVAAGTHVKVRVVPATTAFTTSVTNLNLGGTITSFSVTTTHANPPSWMPMAMLNVAYDSATKKLTVQDLHTHASFPGTTLPALTYVPAGAYDPTKPWGGLSNGVYLSRQLGWDDPTALHGAGITVTGALVNQILGTYGSTASIWIELVSKTPGLETYFADGMFGVGGTSSGALTGTPQPYSNMMTGFPIIYANNYYGIFGTAGSSTKWKWDGTMIHNVYAVPAAYVTQPNQEFSATYKVYVGDADGNEIFNADSSSTSTLKTWSWRAPAALPAQAAKPAYLNIQTFNAQKNSVYLISAPSATPGAVYYFQYSTDGVNWTYIGTPSTIRNPTFTLPAGPGSYQFRVFVNAAGYRESLFATTTGSVTVDLQAPAPTYLNIQTFNAQKASVYLISAPSSLPGALYTFQYKKDSNLTWTNFVAASSVRNPTITLPGPGIWQFQVFVTAPGGFTASAPTTAVGSVTVAAQAPQPAYLNVQSFNATTGNTYLISAPSSIPGALYTFQYRLVGAPTWTDFSAASPVRNPTITVGSGQTEFQVIITAPGGFSASTPKAANTTVIKP